MKSLRFLDRRAGYSLASIGLLLGMVVPAVFPTFASASNVSTRSIQLSSSAAGATSNYELTFTPATTEATGYVVVFFCNDSPIIGQTCTSPTGFNAASATSSPAGVVAATNSLKISQALTASTPVTITFSGIVNPSSPTDNTTGNGFYARVQTYSNSTNATGAVTDGAADITTHPPVDQGGIAMSITQNIGVNAAVRESMTFCVSHTAPTANCATTDAASIVLGHGSPAALDSTAFDTAQDYAQISTNASAGAVVNMQNNNDCGGLKRFGASVCDIAPAGSGDPIAAGTAKFGMKLGATNTLTGGSGTVTPAADFAGTASNYGMTYTGSTGTGVSSTYGAEIFHTGAPINNVNVPLNFAASASNATPAGLYQATLSLIATGTY